MHTYGLLGKNLSHSFSRQYFSDKFANEHIAAEYLNFETGSLTSLPDILKKHPELKGFNVTIPYKEDIIEMLDDVDPEAKAVGAVNTVKVTHGKLIGYNTDVFGFANSIKPFLAHGMEYALVLGTGGAAKAVASVLTNLGLRVSFASRNPSKPSHLAYSELNVYAMRTFKLIVNATPVGTWPEVEQKPALPYHMLTPEHFLYDLVYNPEETVFMKAARAHGAGTTGGLTMLKMQAEKSWEIWNGK